MKVILCQTVKGLGERGDVILVSDGYGRNYLIPRHLAWEANEKNIHRLKEEKRKEQEKDEKILRSAITFAAKLDKISCTITVKTGESEKIFGAVTSSDIGEALRSQGIDVDKKDILLDEPIKELGVYTVKVRVHPKVTGKVKVWVVKE
ncbi:MAG: 50S ribosomal protein L9 [bacterium]